LGKTDPLGSIWTKRRTNRSDRHRLQKCFSRKCSEKMLFWKTMHGIEQFYNPTISLTEYGKNTYIHTRTYQAAIQTHFSSIEQFNKLTIAYKWRWKMKKKFRVKMKFHWIGPTIKNNIFRWW
jgi:predicted choloylglycine hydrolase